MSANYNGFLDANGGVLDVIIAVRGQPVALPQPTVAMAEVILLDCSGSMSMPPTKLIAARTAAAAAINVLRDGTLFAVIAGTHIARQVYPPVPGLAVADHHTRTSATRALRRLVAGGGTAIGRWLLAARSVFTTRPDAIAHAILLTDGRNQTESIDQLDAAIKASAGRFTVDCRAIGNARGSHDWSGTELLRIAEPLGANRVVPVEDLDSLADDFTTMLGVAMNRVVGNVQLRIRSTVLARPGHVKQVYPVIADLPVQATAVDEGTVDYPIGAWGAEHRDYHLTLDVDPMPPGERRIAWLSLIAPGGDSGAQITPEVPIAVTWTHEPPLYTGINETVAHYTRQHELATAIRDGCQALEDGRVDEAARLLGTAVRLAHHAGDHAKLAELQRIVQIEDAAAGRVRLIADQDFRLWQGAIATSTHTRTPAPDRGGKDSATDQPPPDDRPPRRYAERCPKCGRLRRGRVCEANHHEYDPDDPDDPDGDAAGDTPHEA
ncbi:MAG: VWA domain-containing protein [Dactylosporangium sp.]|nr:VWA domain-containing protein [Dactylosporangium sp.]NNJ61426.1 VWA domain-containing protein [Dactylosporangium sp.]